MKTVSGEVISTKSISFKKAAKTLSKFASSDNGASPAFAAYLRRASDSFNELVQLHKDSNLLGSEHKMKKRPSKDFSERTYESAINNDAEGLVKEMAISKRRESRGGSKGEGEAERINVRTEMKKVEGIVDVNGLKNETESFDGSKDTQKKKKKRDELTTEEYDVEVDIEKQKQRLFKSENVGNGQVIHIGIKHGGKQKKNREHSYSDDASIIVRNEIESIGVSKEMKKKMEIKQHEIDNSDGNKEMKKKKKRESHENIKSGYINEATRAMENAGDDQKKYKKSKKDELKEASFGSGINDDEQRDERSKVRRNVENVDKKKQMYEGKGRKHEDKLESEAANNNESRKRKHESVVAQGLDSSQEQHKSKKKKR